jgi:hypothetical protein
MSKGFHTSLAHRIHVALGEASTGESGGVEVVGEDGGLREVDGKSREVVDDR